jgi:hypothetical protein
VDRYCPRRRGGLADADLDHASVEIDVDPFPFFVPLSLRESGLWNTHAEPEGGA